MSSSKPKYPLYAAFSERQVSFKNRPTHLGIGPDLLAESGFDYTVALRNTNFNEDLLNHQVRLNTFVNWPGRANCNTWELAYAGFHFHGISRNADLLRCVFCGLLAKDWRIDDSPWLYHAIHAPECINFLAKKGLAYLYTVYNANPRILVCIVI